MLIARQLLTPTIAPALARRWYAANAYTVWPADQVPTLLDTEKHAKGLRTTKQVQEYFQAYREKLRVLAEAQQVRRVVGPDGAPMPLQAVRLPYRMVITIQLHRMQRWLHVFTFTSILQRYHAICSRSTNWCAPCIHH